MGKNCILHMPLTTPNQSFGGSIRPYGLRLVTRRQLNAEDYSGYPVSYENQHSQAIAAFDSLDNAIEPNKGFDYFQSYRSFIKSFIWGSNIGELYCYSIDKQLQIVITVYYGRKHVFKRRYI